MPKISVVVEMDKNGLPSIWDECYLRLEDARDAVLAAAASKDIQVQIFFPRQHLPAWDGWENGWSVLMTPNPNDILNCWIIRQVELPL